MGLPKFRGRGIGAVNGFVRPAGLGHQMKHSAGPRGMVPRFSLPPAGMSSPPLQLRLQAIRPPGFAPPPLNSAGAGELRPPLPPTDMSSPPPQLRLHAKRPPGFAPPPLNPAGAEGPQPPLPPAGMSFLPPQLRVPTPLNPAGAGGPRPSLPPADMSFPPPQLREPPPLHRAVAGVPHPPLPSANMSLPPPQLRVPAMRPPEFVSPPLNPTGAAGPRPPQPPAGMSLPPPHLRLPAMRSPGFIPPPVDSGRSGGPRPPLPPAGMSLPPPQLRLPAMQPPGFVPPPLNSARAGELRPPLPPTDMSLPPPQLRLPAMRPPRFVPPPFPARAGVPQPPLFSPTLPPPHFPPHFPTHFPPPPIMPFPPPVPPAFNGMQRQGWFQPAPFHGCQRGAASNMGARRKIKNKNQNAGNCTAGVHYCDTCEKNLKDAEKLAQHLAEHTVCGHDGCTFQAHPKVIDRHIRMQHRTGLYKKICVVNNPEDIAKWIQERKNRYPTKANIERREAERKEQVDRGERLGHKPGSLYSFTCNRIKWRYGRGMWNRRPGYHWKFKPRADENSNETAKEGCDAEAAEQDKSKRGHWRMFRGRGLRSRMHGHHWRFRQKMKDNCIDTKMEGSNAQVAEQETFGGVHRFLFRGRGVWNRMHGFYRKKRPEADGNGGEADNHSGEMEAWNAQVAEEEKLLSRGRLISFPGTGAFPDTCEDKTSAPNIQEGGEFSDKEWEGSSIVSHEKLLVASRVLMSLISSYASEQSDSEGNGESAESRAPPVPLTASNSCNGATSERLHPEDAAVQNDSDGPPEEVPIVYKEHAGELPALPSALSTALPTTHPPATDENGEKAHHPSKKRRLRTRPVRMKGIENTTEIACDKTSQRRVAKRLSYPQQRRPTLLDRLLREEIRHERNVILQCINHIVKHSFFSGHSTSKAVEPGTHSPCDNSVKIIAKCISHIVNCGLLDKNDSSNTGNSLIKCS